MKSTTGSGLSSEASSDRKYVSLHTKPPASSFHLIFEIPVRFFSIRFLGTLVSRIDFPKEIPVSYTHLTLPTTPYV